MSARAQYGPGAHRAAELTCAHYLPVGRATALLAALAGIRVSVGFAAGIRGRAARLLERAFLPRVRDLLGTVGVHADETPARAHGGLEYVNIAATEWLTAMHTGGRTTTDIDNGAVLPGYPGTIVRDGYAGYTHLTDAYHAGIRDNHNRAGPLAKDAAALARRFRDHQDIVLRFMGRPRRTLHQLCRCRGYALLHEYVHVA